LRQGKKEPGVSRPDPAALTRGNVGLYQVDIQVPSSIAVGDWRLHHTFCCKLIAKDNCEP
jgi:hypothetical protein